MTRELLTVEDAARLVHTDVTTVRRWIRSGVLRASRPGKAYLIRPEAIDEMLAATEHAPALQPSTPPRPAAPRRVSSIERGPHIRSVRDMLRDRKNAA